MSTNTAVAEVNQKQVAPWVESVQLAMPRFIKQAKIHGAVEWDAEASYIRQAIQASPDLQQCTRKSLVNAIELIGSVGISISPLHNLAFLQAQNVKISAKNVKPEVWEKHAQLKIQFTGLIKIATDSGAAEYIRADVVYENDDFIYNGPTEKPDFKVSNPFGDDRGKVVGAFAEARAPNGITYCEILRIEELESIKSASKTSGYGPWVAFENEMRKKAAIRRLYKTIPKSNDRIRIASSISSIDDGFEMDNSSEAKWQPSYTAEEHERFHKAIEDSNGTALYVMSKTCADAAWIDLYASFPKGKKVSGKELAGKLESSGREACQMAANQLDSYFPSDESGAHEVLEEFSTEELEQVFAFCTNETVQWAGEFLKEAV